MNKGRAITLAKLLVAELKAMALAEDAIGWEAFEKNGPKEMIEK